MLELQTYCIIKLQYSVKGRRFLTKNEPRYHFAQILEYFDCPLAYHLKYKEGIRPTVDVLRNNRGLIYKEAMDETLSYYYRGHLEKKPPTLKQLYDRFYHLWMVKTDTLGEQSILTRKLEDSGHLSREEISKHVQVGYEQLRAFYLQNADLKQSILAVNYAYEIQLSDGVLTGTLPLVREVERQGNRHIELLTFSSSKRKQNLDVLKKSLDNILLSFAFQTVMKIDADQFLLHSLGQDELLPLHFNSQDYKRLFRLIEAFFASVDTVPPHIPPNARYSDPFYKELCEQYTFPTL